MIFVEIYLFVIVVIGMFIVLYILLSCIFVYLFLLVIESDVYDFYMIYFFIINMVVFF